MTVYCNETKLYRIIGTCAMGTQRRRLCNFSVGIHGKTTANNMPDEGWRGDDKSSL
jgi:hypothetical protein